MGDEHALFMQAPINRYPLIIELNFAVVVAVVNWWAAVSEIANYLLLFLWPAQLLTASRIS